MSGDYQHVYPHVELAADVAHGDFEPKYRSGADTLEARAAIEDAYPPMPVDFWPDGLTIAATYHGTELGFRIDRAELGNGVHLDTFGERIDALRHALWVAAHWSNDHLRVADLRSQT